MSNGLTLPYQGSDPSGEDIAFAIDAVTGATAIFGQSNGAQLERGGEPGDAPIGVQGQSDVGIGVYAVSGAETEDFTVGSPAIGVLAKSAAGVGVLGVSYGEDSSGNGVQGISSSPEASGVWGNNTGAGPGVSGSSGAGTGVLGSGKGTGTGVSGSSSSGTGVSGSSSSGNGVQGASGGSASSGVWGNNTGSGVGVAGSSASRPGISGSSQSGNAGEFTGSVHVSNGLTVDGTIHVGTDVVLTGGGDCAEEFDVSSTGRLDAGTVVVIADNGALCESVTPYDRKVAGVISGAGHFRPAIVLDKTLSPTADRAPVALLGKVFCKVDAANADVAVGDLLTTSAIPGHAMKVEDHQRAVGAIIGKALKPMTVGRGLLPILVALQ